MPFDLENFNLDNEQTLFFDNICEFLEILHNEKSSASRKVSVLTFAKTLARRPNDFEMFLRSIDPSMTQTLRVYPNQMCRAWIEFFYANYSLLPLNDLINYKKKQIQDFIKNEKDKINDISFYVQQTIDIGNFNNHENKLSLTKFHELLQENQKQPFIFLKMVFSQQSLRPLVSAKQISQKKTCLIFLPLQIGKWLTRIALQRMKIDMRYATLLRTIHPMALHQYRLTNNIKDVAYQLANTVENRPNFLAKIVLFNPIRPHLAETIDNMLFIPSKFDIQNARQQRSNKKKHNILACHTKANGEMQLFLRTMLQQTFIPIWPLDLAHENWSSSSSEMESSAESDDSESSPANTKILRSIFIEFVKDSLMKVLKISQNLEKLKNLFDNMGQFS